MQKPSISQQVMNASYKANLAPHDTFLNVPFSEKDQARALGAKWNNQVKKWFVPTDKDLNKFKRWIEK